MPAQLALRLGVPLIPARIERRGGARFVITVHRPVEPEAGLDPEEAAVGMTARVNQLFARWIAAAPDQWYCARRRWPRPLAARRSTPGFWPAEAPPTSAGQTPGPRTTSVCTRRPCSFRSAVSGWFQEAACCGARLELAQCAASGPDLLLRLDRTTDGQGRVADYTLAELRRFDAGSWFSPTSQALEFPRCPKPWRPRATAAWACSSRSRSGNARTC